MIYRILIILQLLYILIFFYKNNLVEQNSVLGLDTKAPEVNENPITYKPEIVTTTAFEKKEVQEYEELPYVTIYMDDEDLEYGEEEVQTEGEDGLITYTYLVTFWGNETIDKTLLETKKKEPVSEVISKGKKIVWKTLDTPEYGEIKYWYKMRVWATKYDSTCLGCNSTTALGAPVQQGVCAVDPKVIAMYTHFYVPGYGKCQALDVGGAIKGNKIDLAYEDHTKASWGAAYTDIYLMDNEPQ